MTLQLILTNGLNIQKPPCEKRVPRQLRHPVHVCLRLQNFWKSSYVTPKFGKSGHCWPLARSKEENEQQEKITYIRLATKMPVTVATRSMAWTVFARSNAGRSQWPRGLWHELSSLAQTLAGHIGHAVYGMNCLRSLEHWNRGFEFHSRHGSLCAFLLCLCCSVCR
jgi:hypothetical protein